jgi:hypothetical protein
MVHGDVCKYYWNNKYQKAGDFRLVIGVSVYFFVLLLLLGLRNLFCILLRSLMFYFKAYFSLF